MGMKEAGEDPPKGGGAGVDTLSSAVTQGGGGGERLLRENSCRKVAVRPMALALLPHAQTHAHTHVPLGMAGECGVKGPDLKELDEEGLWELINDHRHRISLAVRPGVVIPYLRQARVLSELDEDEILSCHNLPNRSMRTSYMLDLLRSQGRNGGVALLESLMIHYPSLYTQVTGQKASTEPSKFSGLIKYSELTEYLVRALTGMQKELQEARSEARRMGERCTSLQAEIGHMMEQEQKFRCFRSDNEHMRRQVTAAHREVTRLKDEKCDLSVRYTAAIEEKSAENIRCRDLTLQVYQLQTELQKAQSETDYQKRRSLKCATPAETQQLREELSALRRQIMVAEKFNPAHEDILAQDLAEARDGRMELAEHLRSYRDENERLLREKEESLDKMEKLALQVHQLTLDCDMYKEKITVIEGQIRELQAERDQAYLSRDEAQDQIRRSLADKDALRTQHLQLQERLFSAQGARARVAMTELHDSQESGGSWGSHHSSSEDSSSSPTRPTLRRMKAINPSSVTSFNPFQSEDSTDGSISSRTAEPPCPESLRRREDALYSESSMERFESDSLSDDFVFLPNNMGMNILVSTAPPFLMRSRPKAVRLTGRVLTISFQGKDLLSQLSVVGGNKTGVFVLKVVEGSAAHTVGISPGAQIIVVKYEHNQQALSMMLQDSTLEEALWALGQVRGLCHLSLRYSQEAYESLLQQRQSNAACSGDSFYVRVNMAIPGGPGDLLDVSCNDILHVTNTHLAGTKSTWHASHVHSNQLMDLQGGTVPNYYRAQRLLIRAIEHMSFQADKGSKGDVVAKVKQKAVRIVSTGRQGRNPLWLSIEDSNTKSTEPGDVAPPRGPVLVLPTVLGRVLDKKLASWQGFQLCEPEVLSSSERAVRLQRSEVLEECEKGGDHLCYTLQSVEKVMKKGIHCVLPFGLDCVRRLHRADIFPIIIFIAQSSRSARKLRSKLQRVGQNEEQLLNCANSEESLLDKLPCLCRTVAPDLWGDSGALLNRLRTVIWEEQRKIVWVEPDLW
ncbi:Caspase recruitment domain-containing protein 14 [Merluccius polli]|uniref:Caspase recruitment domain-containing protein 14 n=1 Tax=Merluccius polli TaxID=89951 RepID=A0AA47P7C0_MERPO|nr:Caspase recruitment domain-containing protein 14 [Merluccius polli]